MISVSGVYMDELYAIEELNTLIGLFGGSILKYDLSTLMY